VASQARLIQNQNNTQVRNELIVATGNRQQITRKETAEGERYHKPNNITKSN
jgi:hypothetical protein